MNLTDPIVPGISAAGVSIHDPIQQILAAHPSEVADRFGTTEKYVFDGISLWARDGRVTQIGVRAPYTGKIAGKVGLGSTIGDVTAALGEVAEDTDDSLIVKGSAGWCFETEQWKRRGGLRDNRNAQVTEIFVFRPAATQ